MTKSEHNREMIVALLQKHRPELEAAGALHLALFGSVARGTAGPDSDIDFAAVYDPAKVRGLHHMGGIAARICEIIGTDSIDLADEERLKPPVKRTFERDHVRIF